MRSKTGILGFVALVGLMAFVSITAFAPDNLPKKGLTPGDVLPSIKVDDTVQIDLRDTSSAIVVLWAQSDAQSRLVNAWLSHNATQRIISICVDADTSTARYLTALDGVSDKTEVMGKEQALSLTSKGVSPHKQIAAYQITDGIITSVTPVKQLWQELSISAH